MISSILQITNNGYDRHRLWFDTKSSMLQNVESMCDQKFYTIWCYKKKIEKYLLVNVLKQFVIVHEILSTMTKMCTLTLSIFPLLIHSSSCNFFNNFFFSSFAMVLRVALISFYGWFLYSQELWWIEIQKPSQLKFFPIWLWLIKIVAFPLSNIGFNNAFFFQPSSALDFFIYYISTEHLILCQQAQ